MLFDIVAEKKQEVAARKRMRPLSQLKAEIKAGTFAFGKTIRTSDWALIAECKLASPAKGRLCEGYTVPELAAIYDQQGAAALSVHTDKHFLGVLEDIGKVKSISSLPVLRKDFIIDIYQIYEARAAGADAILLIAAILSSSQLDEYLAAAREMGMDCLVEVHTREEMETVQKTTAELIGINNRNLKTFTTDIQTTFDLLAHASREKVFISESGIRTGKDAERLKKAGIRGVLVGEALVTSNDIAAQTRELALR